MTVKAITDPYVFVVAPPGEPEAAHVFPVEGGVFGLLSRGPVVCRTFLPLRDEARDAARFQAGWIQRRADAAAARARERSCARSRSTSAGKPVDPAAIPVSFDPGRDHPARVRGLPRAAARPAGETIGLRRARRARGAARARRAPSARSWRATGFLCSCRATASWLTTAGSAGSRRAAASATRNGCCRSKASSPVTSAHGVDVVEPGCYVRRSPCTRSSRTSTRTSRRMNAVLADVAAHPVDRLFCLGDVIGYGPNPRECLDLVKRCEFILIGNHEAGLLQVAEDFNDRARRALEWTRETLNSPEFPKETNYGYWDQIDRFVETYRTDDAFFVHGSPRDPIREYVMPANAIDRPMMEEIFGLIDRRVCFAGHTHIPGLFTLERGFVAPERAAGAGQAPGEELREHRVRRPAPRRRQPILLRARRRRRR